MSSLPNEERADFVCDCYEGSEALWGPACPLFESPGEGVEFCLNCGHVEQCHV